MKIVSEWARKLGPINACVGLIFCALLGYFCHGLVKNIDLFWTMSGQGPIEWTYSYVNEGSFEGDFPSSMTNFERSMFMYIYPIMFHLGVSPEFMIKAVTILEVFFSCLVFFVLTRVITQRSHFVLPMMIVALAATSGVRDMGLARFGYPFLGMYYHFVDLMRVFAIVAALRQKSILAMFFLALATITHPPLGLMGVVFVLAIFLAQKGKLPWVQLSKAGLLFLFITGSWFLVFYREAGLTTGGIPDELWTKFSRFASYHWYAFSRLHWQVAHPSVFFLEGRLLSFLSFCMLYGYYFKRIVPSQYQRKLFFGCLAAAAMSVFGILVSIVDLHPSLIKLSLQRSTDLLILTGLPVVVTGLYRDTKEGILLRSGVALLLLISPFLVLKGGFPVVLTLLLIGISVSESRPFRQAWKIHLGLSIGIVSIMVFAWLEGLDIWRTAGITGPYLSYKRLLLPVGLIFIALKWFQRRDQLKFQQVLSYFSILLVVGLGFYRNSRPLNKNWVQVARNYKATQLWARDGTPEGSLFMPDPGIQYGWRTYSRRPSFGCLREWIYVGWMYNADKNIFDEGLRRVAELNVDIYNFLDIKPIMSGHGPLIKEIRNQYYRLNDKDRIRITRRYGVSYFVIFKALYKGDSSLPVVYENEDFLILQGRKTGI